MSEPTCDVCYRRRSWGCGHTPAMEREARAHRRSAEHKAGDCECFDHSACNPTVCANAGRPRPGYAPFYTHADASAGKVPV